MLKTVVVDALCAVAFLGLTSSTAQAIIIVPPQSAGVCEDAMIDYKTRCFESFEHQDEAALQRCYKDAQSSFDICNAEQSRLSAPSAESQSLKLENEG